MSPGVPRRRSGIRWAIDGTRFATFESSPVPELASRPVFGFMEDREGGLWIGHSRGATRYRNGHFERVISDELMEGRRVWAFAQARDGAVWAATENGLVILMSVVCGFGLLFLRPAFRPGR